MSNIISLYGGPGTGKSTSAAYLYYRLKDLGQNAELVREYVKDWAWENRHISEFDQFYFMGKQMRKESMLFGKVNQIITDAPIVMNILYAQKYCSEKVADAVEKSVLAYLDTAAEQGHTHHHVFLNRSKEYNPKGRFQTEQEAKEVDRELKDLLSCLKIMSDRDIYVHTVNTDRYSLDEYLSYFLDDEETNE